MNTMCLKLCMICCCLRLALGGFAEEVTRDGASGAQVVQHVVDLIGQTCLIDNEFFLRRMAYVETKDGTDTQTYRAGYHGGIWNIDEAMFNATKNQSNLMVQYEEIKRKLHIDWSTVTWKDVRKPINSGLAVALLLLSKNIRTIPESAELQATIWGVVLHPGTSANKFYLNTLQLQTQCQANKELDLVIVLDFHTFTPFDLVKLQTFLDSLIKKFQLSLDATRVALVTKRIMPIAGWYLNSQRPGLTILDTLRALTYTAGPTSTGDSLKFARETMFTVANGYRPGAAKVALLLTDGITQYNYTRDEVHKLQDQGISLMVLELDAAGNGTSNAQLDKLVQAPKCRNANTVKGFAKLEAAVDELEITLCSAPVILGPGDYTFPCATTLTAKLPDTSKSVSVKVTTTNEKVDVFGAKMYTEPDESSHDVHLVSNTTDSPVLFIRGTNPMYIRVKSHDTGSTCAGTYTVHVKKADLFSGKGGSCVIAGTVRDCTEAEMGTAVHDIVLTRDPDIPNLCDLSTHTVEYFPDPLDAEKFIMCDQHEQLFVGLCPINTTQCHQVTAGCNYANPCAIGAVSGRHMYYNDPCGDTAKYVTCSEFGIAEVSECSHMRIWNKDTQHCVFKYVHNPLLGTDDTHVTNPCIYSHEDHVYFPFPGEPTKYILCDINGNAFESKCRAGVWNQQTLSCTDLSPPVG